MNAETAKQEAIARAGAHANDEWLTAALVAIHEAARQHRYFTTDHVWPLLDGDFHTHDRRAMGAAMKMAAGDGIIEATLTWEESGSAVNHRRPLRVWKSKICLHEMIGVPGYGE